MQKRIQQLFILLFFSLFLSACGSGEKHEDEYQESSEAHANIVFAEEFIMFMSEGRFKQATEYYDQTMKEELPAEELEKVWNSLEGEYGDFVSQEYDRTEIKDEYEILFINGEFENGNVVFQITIDQDEKIAGFYIL